MIKKHVPTHEDGFVKIRVLKPSEEKMMFGDQPERGEATRVISDDEAKDRLKKMLANTKRLINQLKQ
jgi:hypothetical protein